MRILHVPYSYYPDAVGGTEVYVHALAVAQRDRGYSIAIAAPGTENASYEHGGIQVRRFATSTSLELGKLYGDGDAIAAESFRSILEGYSPDILHLHAFTSAVSGELLRVARSCGATVILTCHTANILCGRGTLLRFGSSVCDGVMSVRDCSACTLHGHGLNRAASTLVSYIPPAAARISGECFNGRVRTVLRMPELMQARCSATSAFLRSIDQVVAVCEWIRDALVRNGVPINKVTLCRQGLPFSSESHRQQSFESGGSTLRIAFLGRLSQIKGILMLANALSSSPIDATLDIYGVVQSEDGERIRNKLRTLASQDSRIRVLPAVAPSEVVPILRQYDLLVVPSQCLETGPLVVYEAFAAGVPVLGSNLGGIAELVKHRTDGILVDHDSQRQWIDALGLLSRDRTLLQQLRRGVPKPRTMEQVVDEMADVYHLAVRSARMELVQ